MVATNPAIGNTVEAAGHRTNYFDLGEGEPLILLHGSGPGVSAYWNWKGVMAPLSEHFRVLAPDIAGFGYSEFKDDAHYNIKLWVNHLLGFMDALDIPSATLVGNSFGGGLTLATNMRNAHRIDRMILMGTPAGEFERTSGLAEGMAYEPSLENMREALMHLPFDPSVITDELVQARYEASARPGAQEAMRKLFPPSTDPTPVVRGVPESAIREMKQPTLVIHGREDRSIPLEVGVNLLRWLENAEAHFFSRCGHWVQAERPEAFVRLIVDFCRRHPVDRVAAAHAS